jgi:hypothetical protein
MTLCQPEKDEKPCTSTFGSTFTGRSKAIVGGFFLTSGLLPLTSLMHVPLFESVASRVRFRVSGTRSGSDKPVRRPDGRKR